MALPTSPSVVVIENDISVFAPNVDSSVVGLVGFANKGPTNKATLITSPENLIRKFGEPNSTIPGQGLEGAIEILEATNQLYFVRGIDPDKTLAYASATVAVGASPALVVSGYDPALPSSIYYSITDNATNTAVTATVTIASSTDFTTSNAIIENAFNPSITSDQDVFAYIEGSDLFLASKFAGSGATLQLSAPAPIGFRAVNISGAVSSTGAASDITVNGYTSSDVNLIVNSIYPGSDYNLTTLRNGNAQGVSIEIENLSTRDRIGINSDGALAESFNPIQLGPSGVDSVEFILNSTLINNQSEYVFAELEKSTSAYLAPNQFGSKADAAGFGGFGQTASDGTPRFLKVIEGTYGLADGESGGASATHLIGSKTTKTGIYALDDDGLNISIGLIPGITDDSVQNAFISLAETSKNFMAIVSPPYALNEVQEAIQWMHGQDLSSRVAALISSYAAVYWPWVQVFNAFAGADEWYDPSIFAARQCVFTDSVNDPWFAPAGFRRGRLTKPTNTEVRVNQGDRDALYVHNINPIANEPQTGIVVFGQKTAQRLPTALDRVNVRRLMIYVRKVLLQLGKPFQFEPNDSFTWEQVTDAVKPFLTDLISRRAITEGAVKCDSSTNTPLRVDRNELWCSVTIKPTKAAETVVFEVNLTSQSATIS